MFGFKRNVSEEAMPVQREERTSIVTHLRAVDLDIQQSEVDIPECKVIERKETANDVARIWLGLTYGEAVELAKQIADIEPGLTMVKRLEIWARRKQAGFYG